MMTTEFIWLYASASSSLRSRLQPAAQWSPQSPLMVWAACRFPVSHCHWEALVFTALQSGSESREAGGTGTSKVGLAMCKAARLLFLERLPLWRRGEVFPWDLVLRWAPQLLEGSGEGSEFTVELPSGQGWAVWGFPWGQEADRSGERAADSRRPLVPCVHWRRRRRGKKVMSYITSALRNQRLSKSKLVWSRRFHAVEITKRSSFKNV